MKLSKRIEAKLKLMRTIHGVEQVWITANDVYTEEPKNFTGIQKGWHENGQLKYEDNFKDGERHNLSCGWYDSGQLEYEENFKNGEFHGLCRSWYDNGQLEYADNFKDGELIE